MPHRQKLGENLESFMRRFSRRSSFIILSVAALLCQPLHAEKILRIATDGSAPFHTPQQALAQLDADEKESVVLELAAGVYQGPLVIAARKQPLRMIGESAESTIITWDRNVNDPRPDGADQLVGLGRGEDETQVLRRLFDKLEQRVRRLGRELMGLVDDVHLIRRFERHDIHALAQLADIADELHALDVAPLRAAPRDFGRPMALIHSSADVSRR